MTVAPLCCPAFQIHYDEAPGDVLVFLTGQEEIESMERLLAARAQAASDDGSGGLLVAPIYAAMPREQQMRVFEPTPGGMRKVRSPCLTPKRHLLDHARVALLVHLLDVVMLHHQPAGIP